ncbi:MAG TPA: ABC transporter substrate-binding protein [Sphingobium sp.]|uniref:ABC transporter substrate-binding protein n=1 Tax=Sphingobium sp. TaxID=1912891 RepID=UPI002ED06958
MAAPIKVGLLNDMSDGPPCPSDIESWLRREVDTLVANGRIDRPVEFVQAHGLGLPGGTAAAVERAVKSLADQDVLAIIGPAIGDNALVATPLVERLGVPTINWAGAERARGEWMFHLQVGSHEDESLVIAHHLADLGVQRVGVIHDRSPIGRRHLEYLRSEAEILGLDLVAIASIAPLAEEAGAQVDCLAHARCDAVVYLGLGLSTPAVANELSARDWLGHRVMNTAGLRGYHGDFARIVEGWAYVDMHSDGNRTLGGLRERLSVPPERALAAAKGHDLGRLLAEGLAHAPELTRAGVREGLERVKWLPAAEGLEGTLLGFGKQDRGALHGRYLVMRQWIGGRSIEMPGPHN